MVNFGNTLKELRLKAGMTQKDLASKVGVTKSVISYYELSERSPSPEMLMKLAAVFHVSTDFLLGIQKQDTLDLTGCVRRSAKPPRPAKLSRGSA